jgi:hypothetical protein
MNPKQKDFEELKKDEDVRRALEQTGTSTKPKKEDRWNGSGLIVSCCSKRPSTSWKFRNVLSSYCRTFFIKASYLFRRSF